MKISTAVIFCLLSVSVIAARKADAQTIHTVFGDRKANTEDDLKAALPRCPFTWETPDGKSTVTFNANGTGELASSSITWVAKSPQELEVTMPGSPNKGLIRFSNDYTTYSGMDFQARTVHGSIVMKKAPVATPTPPQMIATGTAAPTPGASPSPGSSNPFLTSSSLTTGGLSGGGGGAADPSGGLEQAITNATYTWENGSGDKETVTFKPGGTGKQTFFSITWRVKTPHELELAIPGQKEYGKIVIRFNNDFTKFSGTDFDGESALAGRKK